MQNFCLLCLWKCFHVRDLNIALIHQRKKDFCKISRCDKETSWWKPMFAGKAAAVKSSPAPRADSSGRYIAGDLPLNWIAKENGWKSGCFRFLQNLKSDLRCLQKAIKKALLGFWDLPLCIDFCPFPKPKSIHSRGSDSAHRHACQVGKSNCDLCCPLRSVRLSLNKRIVPERAADGNQNIWRMLNMVAGGDDPAAPESPTLGRHVWRIQYRPSEQQTPPNSMHRPASRGSWFFPLSV